MTVYVRTDQGLEAAYQAESALPRKLRSILKLIDGRTTLRMFEQNLQSFGDVRSIFKSLAEAGYITVLPEGAQHVRVNMHASDAERQRLMEPNHADDWMATRSPYSEHLQPADVLTNEQAGGLHAALSDTQTLAVDQEKAAALKAVLDNMAGFVLTHVPDQSFLLLKEIEEITSMELLAVTLGGYAQMISHLGTPSVEHVKYIKRVLQDNL
jgi:hypothetical protein